MNFRNESPYHTATLRKIAVRTFKAMGCSPGWPAKVVVREGRTRARANLRLKRVEETSPRAPPLELYVPKLTGNECVVLLRQQHGGGPSRYGGEQPDWEEKALGTARFASAVQSAVYVYAKRMSTAPLNLDLEVRAALKRAKLPAFIPLKPPKERKEKEPRNIVQERYKRVVEAEARWSKKLKLAQTKLKKIRAKKKHYHKKLNITQEES